MTVVAPADVRDCDIVVIGSGPGGAVTAATLAEGGRDVVLIEEGSNLPQDSCAPFSFEEMTSKYRSGGITVAMGAPNVAYAEGSVVGGGSEVNSGLYHRTPERIVDEWLRDYAVADLSMDSLAQNFAACEAVMQPATYPGALPSTSRILRAGAEKEGWSSSDIPRLVQFDSEQDQQGVERSTRHSMSKSYLPRFYAAGGKLLPDTRVNKLARAGNGWTIHAAHSAAGQLRINAQSVFVCCGATHTPALLRRSGIKTNVGNSLAMQPMVKLTAEFADEVNYAGMGIAGEQVKEFSPEYSFGCAISSAAHMAINLAADPEDARYALANPRRMVSYYVMSRGTSSGSVRNVPGFSDPLVRYRVSAGELHNLGQGVRNLARLLLAAGAKRVFTGLPAHPVVSSTRELEQLPDTLPAGADNVMTIHLMSSCPMGENRERAAVDSWGRVHGEQGLYVSDVSIVCSSLGVNPQGTIMALAKRNSDHFLGA